MYHTALKIASFWETLFILDGHVAEAFMQGACCEQCGHRDFVESLYSRKPRGFPEEIESNIVDDFFRTRISFRCGQCRKRVTPPSVRFLGRKVYIGAVILWATRLIEQGNFTAGAKIALLGIKKILSDFLPARTARRWVGWWRGAVWVTPFWRERQGQLAGYIEQHRFLCGVWDHVNKVTSLSDSPLDFTHDVTRKVLEFFSPITHPPIYPF